MQKDSKHKNESIEFITWLLSSETAKYMMNNNFTYIFANPEVTEPVDTLGRSVVLCLLMAAIQWREKSFY